MAPDEVGALTTVAGDDAGDMGVAESASAAPNDAVAAAAAAELS